MTCLQANLEFAHSLQLLMILLPLLLLGGWLIYFVLILKFLLLRWRLRRRYFLGLCLSRRVYSYGWGFTEGCGATLACRILKRIFVAVLIGTSAVLQLLWFMDRLANIPGAVILLAPLLLLLIMGGSRLIYRAWKERRLYSLESYEAKLVLVLGAGSTAVNLVKVLAGSRDWHVVGMLDDDPRKLGTRLQGVRVLGTINELPQWVHKLNVEHVIIAVPSDSHRIHRQALEMCSEIGVKAMTVPSYVDLISGKMTVSQIREIQLDDLLGRDPVVLDDDGLHGLLTGKVVLVTGAGGSIGSELCRQLIAFEPDRIVFLELNEFALYTIQEEFLPRFPKISMSFVIGDIKDHARMVQLFTQFRPSVVFHAAAYKHVPLMEQENGCQALLNNVLGTYLLAQVAVDFGVEKFVLISTDKAVNPVSIMGASKRLAEMVCQALQQSQLKSEQTDLESSKPPNLFCDGTFWQCAGKYGQCNSKIPRTDCKRRADNSYSSRNDALFHVHSRSGAIGFTSGIDGRDKRWRGNICVGYGGSSQDC
jgi:FlaA1/EpsC-like NDP-sugar epimerase